MKRHLFYTFLFAFIATTVVTLLGVIGVVKIESGYLTSLVAATLVELAGALIALFRATDFFLDDEQKAKPDRSKFPDSIIHAQHHGTAPPITAPHVETIEYFKTAHFYWLGSDLMELVNIIRFTAGRKDSTRALSQSLRHFKKSGLNNTEIEARLKWLININDKKPDAEWETVSNRKDLLNEILVVRDLISKLIADQAGPRFKPWAD